MRDLPGKSIPTLAEFGANHPLTVENPIFQCWALVLGTTILPPLACACRSPRCGATCPNCRGEFSETCLPDAANAIDIFAGRWASDLATINPDWRSGGTQEFGRDDRPAPAARYLGVAERFDGMSVLELGPLEGIHAYQLAQLGAKR